MKPYVILVILTIILIAGCTVVSEPKPNYKLEVVPVQYNFGSIKAEDGIVTGTVKLSNSGSQDLEILGISTSCGCTEAEADKELLKPGEEANLKIAFDPNAHEGLTGELKRIVYIRTNNPDEPETQVRVIVTVEEDHEHEKDHEDELQEFEISPFDLHEKIEDTNPIIIDVRSKADYEEIHIPGAVNIPLNDLSLDSLSGIDKNDELIVYGKSSITGKIAYNKLKTLEYQNVKMLFGGFAHWEEDGYDVTEGEIIDSPEQSIKEGPEIVFDRTLHDFGVVPQLGGIVSTEFTVFNNGDKDIEIYSISTSCGCTSAEIESDNINPGQHTTLTVFFDPNYHEEPEGVFKRTVFLETNDPDNLEAEVRIQVEVLEGQ